MITPLIFTLVCFILGKTVSPAFFILAALGFLDFTARRRQYKAHLRKLQSQKGDLYQYANKFRHSQRQRQALIAAAHKHYHFTGKCVEDHYKSLGYRWYHILPDVVFKKPKSLLTWKYWKNALGLKIMQ